MNTVNNGTHEMEVLDRHSMDVIVREIQQKDLYIEKLKRENVELQNKIKELSKSTSKKNDVPQSRYWRKDEHERFLEALEKYGKKDVRSISGYVGTRSPTQVRTHAQKWFLKQKRENDRGDKKGSKKKWSSSSDDDEGTTCGDDSNDSYNGNVSIPTTRNIATRTTTKAIQPSNAQNVQYGNVQPKLVTQNDLQFLLDGIRKYDYEIDMNKKLELVKQNYLPHFEIEDIARLIATYPIAVDPTATSPEKKYFFPHIMQRTPIASPMTHLNHGIQLKQDPLLYSHSNSTQPNEYQNMDALYNNGKDSSGSLKEQPDIHTHDKDDEDLENELQNLQKNAKPAMGGLSGYLGHPIGLSPTFFLGSLEYPILSQTPILGDNVMSPFCFSKTATSPLYFIGAEHKKIQ